MIGVCVHEVNTLAHPTVPPGWRWAVHVGDDWADTKRCLNAGWEPTQAAALLAGEAAGVCAAKVAQLLGASGVELRSFVLDRDPVKPGADLIRVGG